MSFFTVLLWLIYIVACLFLNFVVLIQKGEGGGLAGMQGGAVDTAFGSKADMTWKRATAVSAAVFMLGAITLGILQNHEARKTAAGTKDNKPTISGDDRETPDDQPVETPDDETDGGGAGESEEGSGS